MLSVSERANAFTVGFLLSRGSVMMTRLVIERGGAGIAGAISDHTGIRVPAGSVALIIESIATLRTIAVIESVNSVAGGDPRTCSSFAILCLTAFAMASESSRVRTTGTGAGIACAATGAFVSAVAFALADAGTGF